MIRPAPSQQFLWTLLALAILSVSACTTTHYREKADAEVYSLIDEKTPGVPGMPEGFTIDQDLEPVDAEAAFWEEFQRAGEPAEFLGDFGEAERGAPMINLEQALFIAVQRNRTYQNEREIVYLAALDLTFQEDRFRPFFTAGGSTRYNRTTFDSTEDTLTSAIAQGAPELVTAVGQLTGTPGELISRYSQLVESAASATGADQPRTVINEDRSVSGSTRVGVDLLLKGGGSIALDLTSNFLRFLTFDPRVATSSTLSAQFIQPLLRGAGYNAAMENLTQTDRNLLYALRDFTRFRQEFAVSIATQYYRVLQSRDSVRNNYLGYQALLQAADRDRALAVEGRRTEGDVGRSTEAALAAQDRWIQSLGAYREALDSFKIQLGLSTDADLVLDDAELRMLEDEGIQDVDIAAEEAVIVALASRLDLYTLRDRVADSERRLKLAEKNLLPDLTLVASAAVDSTGQDNFQELDFRRMRWTAGLDFDPGLERTAERNTYRSALINWERTGRAHELGEDNVKLAVRGAWRDLDEARRSYEIRLSSVRLNERRVELEDLMAELGRATALDRIDAQNDLIASRNALTAALVNHKVTLLEFWRDMGILYIKPDGQWENLTDERFD
jgi:outer membrane protein TolC